MHNSCVSIPLKSFHGDLDSVFSISPFFSYQDSDHSLWWARLGSNPKERSCCFQNHPFSPTSKVFLLRLDVSVLYSLMISSFPKSSPVLQENRWWNYSVKIHTVHGIYLKNLTLALGLQAHKSVKESLRSGGVCCLGVLYPHWELSKRKSD